MNNLRWVGYWSRADEMVHIGTIVLHVFGSIDWHACHFQVGTFALDREQHDRFGVYGRPIEDYTNLTDVPDIQDTRAQLQTLRSAVFETLDGVTDRDLCGPRYGEHTYWWKEHR